MGIHQKWWFKFEECELHLVAERRFDSRRRYWWNVQLDGAQCCRYDPIQRILADENVTVLEALTVQAHDINIFPSNTYTTKE